MTISRQTIATLRRSVQEAYGDFEPGSKELEEAIERALAVVFKKGNVSVQELADVAHAVGVI